MQRTELASLYKATPADGTKVTVCGWAKTVRDSKNIGFISLSDGSCYKPVQIVFQADKLANYAEIAKCGLYTSFEVTGTLVRDARAPSSPLRSTPSRDHGAWPLRRWIIRCRKSKMGMDYLRTMTAPAPPHQHRSNAAFRVRAARRRLPCISFFHEHGLYSTCIRRFLPALTARAPARCSSVTTLDPQRYPPATTRAARLTIQQGLLRKRPVNLTVSGQLDGRGLGTWPWATSTPSALPSAPRRATIPPATPPSSG